ncbi:hypothetical protein BGZ80_005086 [Entomortierella chlamydospora]|uniref:Uncharacterized protein n=1 Tax=Entomortierella chlamydospora TaxID=101097 RepID=A0A9P6SVC5_9FUNG|nr:hypothetical protein BGZ80_005086 [Entomortierella chlamydospora]
MKLQPDTMQDEQRAEKAVDDILKLFGLKLVGPFVTPGLQMLQALYGRIESEGKASIETNRGSRDNREVERGLTVDYSRYFSEIRPEYWGYMHFSEMIRLRKLPEIMYGSGLYDSFDWWIGANNGVIESSITSGVGTMAGATMEVESDEMDEEHTLQEQCHPVYTDKLQEALMKLWFHCNHDYITSFTFDIYNADFYLPFATKMRKLQALNFPKPRSVLSDNLTESAVLFIKQNQETFSRKSQLDVEFDSGWFMEEGDYPRDGIDEFDMFSVDLATYNERMQKRRRHALNFMKPMLSILEAAGLPTSMSVEEVPFFYDNAHAIGTDRLLDFTDTDQSRFEQGEGPAMEAFLRRCGNLKTLCLGVGSANMLSWAADEALRDLGLTRSALSGFVSNSDSCSASEQETKSSTPPRSSKKEMSNKHRNNQQQQKHTSLIRHSMNLLNSLRSLKLFSDHSYRSAIHTMNDAMVAFAGPIKEIELRGYYYINEDSARIPGSLMKEWDRNSFKLRNNPWANQIGEWPILLPQLSKISVILRNVACIQVGSFSQCPNLQVLYLEFGGLYPSDRDVGPYGELYDIEPVPKPDDDVIQADLDDDDTVTQSQWLQADVDRTLFPTWNLPNLVVLRLKGLPAVRFDFASLSSMKNLEHLELDAAKRSTRRGTERYDMGEYKEYQQQIWNKRLSHQHPSDQDIRRKRGRSNTGTVKWPLPALKEMILRGPPASMFHLNWIRECPKLVALSVNSDDDVLDIRHNIFFAADLNESRNRRDKGRSSHIDHPSPFLMKVTFNGEWTFSEETLRHFLTVHAPLLFEFYLDHDPANLSSFQLFKAIHDIYDSNNQTLSGSNLLLSKVNSNCSLDSKEAEKLGLIEFTEKMYRYEGKLRIYKTSSGEFVRQEQYERVCSRDRTGGKDREGSEDSNEGDDNDDSDDSDNQADQTDQAEDNQ